MKTQLDLSIELVDVIRDIVENGGTVNDVTKSLAVLKSYLKESKRIHESN